MKVFGTYILLRIAVIFLMLIPSLPSFAQSDEDLVAVANEMYNFGDVKDALEIYKQAAQINEKNAYANYMVGRCYLETIHKEKSLPYLMKAYGQDKQIAFNILYLIGSSYHLGYNFDMAIEYYEMYRKKLQNERENENYKTKDELKKIDRRIEECKNGKDFINNPVNVKIENMGLSVNSPFADYAPVISADQSMMFFTSRREGSTGGNKANDNDYYEDIYFSQRVGDEWSKAVNMGKTINSNLHEASIGLSQDGKILFIYKDDDKNTGDIFMCRKDAKGKWSNLVSMGKEINSEYIENSVTISKDGQRLFFASNRPGGFGGMDIYMSKLLKNGKWGKPENLGEMINTTYDDEGPYIDSDGKSIYFSSKGHKGMGGFDIFKSVYDSTTGKWSEPVNLGYPINSTDDDIYFVISGDDECGYYASVKSDTLEQAGMGGVDLFRIYFNVHLPKDSIKTPSPVALNKEVKKQVVDESIRKPSPKYVLELAVFSKGSQIPLEASIEIFDTRVQKVIYSGISKNGKLEYSFSESNLKDLMITVTKEGYVYKKEKLQLPMLSEANQKISKTILLDKIEVGNKFILRNIYFEFDKDVLIPSSVPELNTLYTFLVSNPQVKIEIQGHTDSKGSQEYNLILSKKRAEAIVAYLVKKGISPKRLTSTGFGELRPLATNDDEEEGRELNRRTEVHILSK